MLREGCGGAVQCSAVSDNLRLTSGNRMTNVEDLRALFLRVCSSRLGSPYQALPVSACLSGCPLSTFLFYYYSSSSLWRGEYILGLVSRGIIGQHHARRSKEIKRKSEISHNKTGKAGLEGARITTIDRAGTRGKKGQAPPSTQAPKAKDRGECGELAQCYP